MCLRVLTGDSTVDHRGRVALAPLFQIDRQTFLYGPLECERGRVPVDQLVTSAVQAEGHGVEERPATAARMPRIIGQCSERRLGPRGATGKVAVAIARASANPAGPEVERPVTVTHMKLPPRRWVPLTASSLF